MPTPFTIYVMQSAHTDIGYTHPQEQVMSMYIDIYDRMLDLCQKTASAPETQRFKWTCETSWQVRHYLTVRPERLAEFVGFVQSGQIEITASYLHFTDLIDADAYRRSLDWVTEFCRTHQLPLKAALHCDINGWPWAIPDLLVERDIPYFASCVHIDNATDPLGQRGSAHYHWLLENGEALRPDLPIRVPQAFWWKGPAGNQILHWLGEHYLMGNVLGLSGHQGFHAYKSRDFWRSDRDSADDLYSIANQHVPAYIERLRAAGYTDDKLLISTGGYYVDNAPADNRWCDLIARWNGEHDDIHLRTATLGEWFAALTANDNSKLPVYQVAWPDHWAHGLGTMTARMAQARRTQRRRADAVALVEQAKNERATVYLNAALEQERFALEHTFGGWMSAFAPLDGSNDFLQETKNLTFHRTEYEYDEAISNALSALAPESADKGLYVYGTQAGSRIVQFNALDRTLDPAAQVLAAPDGTHYPFQRNSLVTDKPQFVATLPIAHAGLTRFEVVSGTNAPQETSAATELKTAAWLLTVDPATGGLSSLRDSATGREWVGNTQPYGFGQLVHEVVSHPLAREGVGNRARFMALEMASDKLRQSWDTTPPTEHSVPQVVTPPSYHPGSVFDAILVNAGSPQIGKLIISWRVYHALPVVELVIDWEKAWNDLPEADYVAFPFASEKGQLRLETGGGFFQPGSHDTGGQLPGTSSSYYTIQRAAHIQNEDGSGLLWMPLDAPLVMTQQIKYDRWETDPYQWNGFLASMPVNHYWHTNFPVNQRGYIRLRYLIAAAGDPSALDATLQQALPIDALGWR